MTWTSPRKISIRIPATTKFEPELLATFEIQPDQKDAFQEIVTEYFNFCVEKGARIQIINEISDDNGDSASMMIGIIGERNVVSMKLQEVGGRLLQHSTQVR